MAKLELIFKGSDETKAAVNDVAGGLHDVGAAADEAGQKGSGFFSNMLSSAAGFLTANVIGAISNQFTGFIGDAIGDAREANVIMAQTEAVIKSTGGAAGLTAQEIADMASSMSAAAGKSLFGDDEIQKGENVLLTFTAIGKDVFPLVTQTGLDMAQALGKTPEAMNMMLGKALQSAEGVSALRKQGVTFTDEQEKQIKTLFATGHAADAQRMILAELQKEFGGSAEAAAKADGGMAQFKDQLGEVGESLGQLVLPIINRAAGLLSGHLVPALQGAVDFIDNFSKSLEIGAMWGGHLGEVIETALTPILGSGLAGAIGDVADEFQSLLPAVKTVSSALSALANDVFRGDLDGIGEWFRDWLDIDVSPFLDGIQTVRDAISGVAEHLSATFSDAANPVEGLLNVLSEVSPTFELIRGTVEAVLPPILQIVEETLGQISTFWAAHGEEITSTVQTTWAQIDEIIQLAIELVKETIVPALQFVAAFIAAHGAEIQAVLSGAWKIISGVIDAALTLIKGVIKVALDIIHGDWSQAWTDIQEMSARFVTDLLQVFEGAFEALKSLVAMNIDLVISLFDGMPGQVAGVGEAVVGAIQDGIEGAWDRLVDWFDNKLAELRAKLPFSEPRDSTSPLYGLSKSGMAIIANILEGLEDAIPDLLNAVTDMAGDLAGAVQDMADKVSSALADAFDASASIDRQAAKNIDAVRKFAAELQGAIQGELDKALEESRQIQDPAEAEAYYKLRSDQILEIAGLQQDLMAAEQNGDQQAIAAAKAKLTLIQDAQDAERKALAERQKGQSQTEQFTDEMLDFQTKLTASAGEIEQKLLDRHLKADARANLEAQLAQIQAAQQAFSPIGGLLAQLANIGGQIGGPVTLPPPTPMGMQGMGVAGAGAVGANAAGANVTISFDDRSAAAFFQQFVKVTVNGMQHDTSMAANRRGRSGG